MAPACLRVDGWTFYEQRRHASVMTGYGAYLVLPAALLWFAILLLPWRAWNTREKIDANPRPGAADLSDISVLIPARNEAGHILDTLNALARQGGGLKAIVIDDCSSDRTADAARQAALENLTVIHGKPRPVSWSGKLWALEQGLAHVHTRLTLLMVIAFWLPVAGLFFPGMTARGVCLIALIFMTITYSPVLRFYRSGLIWGLTLPLAGMLYLSITWISAFRYWCGERSRWKGRIYHADEIRY